LFIFVVVLQERKAKEKREAEEKQKKADELYQKWMNDKEERAAIRQQEQLERDKFARARLG
jgi:mevalonate pyrophosphate decarboxylase